MMPLGVGACHTLLMALAVKWPQEVWNLLCPVVWSRRPRIPRTVENRRGREVSGQLGSTQALSGLYLEQG